MAPRVGAGRGPKKRFPREGDQKRCCVCLSLQDVSAFYSQKDSSDGLYPVCKSCHSQRGREIWREQRMKVLLHYSAGDLRCACCGERTYEFLSVDHINGGGNKHRQSGAKKLTQWLAMNGYPEGYQVLCHNCNQAKGYYGGCPHQRVAA